MNILLTGATGFLGQHLVKELINSKHELYLLIRPESEHKIDSLFSDIKSKITVVYGDIANTEIFTNLSEQSLIFEKIDTVIHAAAEYKLDINSDESYVSNVIGTQNILYNLKKFKNLKFFHYISTIAVSGSGKNIFYEADLNIHQTFNNNYAKSKFNAETIVQQYNLIPNLVIRIYRLGILIGDTITGNISKVDGPYYFFKLFNSISSKTHKVNKLLNLYFPIIFPFNKNALIYIVPVDETAHALNVAITNPKHLNEKLKTYQVVPDSGEKIEKLLNYSLNYFNIKVKPIPIIKNSTTKYILSILNIPKTVEDYLYQTTKFDNSEFSCDYPEFKFKKFEEYKDTIFNFAKANL